jgi:glycogen phosphorylase
MHERSKVAYLSMEIALEPAIQTYSGGLGVLAGDTLRSAADMGLDVVGLSLLHRQGYFRQHIDRFGRQREEPYAWDYEALLEPLAPRVEVEIEGRRVAIRAWLYRVRGRGGAEVPVYLLDVDLPENDAGDRRFTDVLYGGDARYRLCQETILGLGGVRMLRALGHVDVDRFHLNEGHAALAILALLEERLGEGGHGPELPFGDAVAAVRETCVFTTHTPVPAGHDRFPRELALAVLGERRLQRLGELGLGLELNMTALALRCSRFINGVALRHGEVSRGLYPDYPIHSITNGIHPPTWASQPFRELFDRRIPSWQRDATTLRYAVGIPLEEIFAAHRKAKSVLLARANVHSRPRFRSDVLTIGFARRATSYKRAALIFQEAERLAAIAESVGPVQLVFAGKAHPADAEGKALIRRIFEMRRYLRRRLGVCYLPGYDMNLAAALVSGCDLWLNTPVPPLEASGTSGMKAALNGVPSLSILDGWWVEGCVEGVTGWAIGHDAHAAGAPTRRDEEDARALYEKLEYAVLPTYYARQRQYLEIMRNAIALNASFFNTQRMLFEYLHFAYRPQGTP